MIWHERMSLSSGARIVSQLLTCSNLRWSMQLFLYLLIQNFLFFFVWMPLISVSELAFSWLNMESHFQFLLQLVHCLQWSTTIPLQKRKPLLQFGRSISSSRNIYLESTLLSNPISLVWWLFHFNTLLELLSEFNIRQNDYTNMISLLGISQEKKIPLQTSFLESISIQN